MSKRKSPILELTKKIFAVEVLFIIGYNILVYPYVNATNNFSVKMTLTSDTIIVMEEKSLEFAAQVAGSRTNVITRPLDENAGIFKVTGSPNSPITAQVMEKKVILTTGNGNQANEKIPVNNFKMGGSVNGRGKGTIGADGVLRDIRVGGTAHIGNADIVGDYSGTATLRIAYR